MRAGAHHVRHCGRWLDPRLLHVGQLLFEARPGIELPERKNDQGEQVLLIPEFVEDVEDIDLFSGDRVLEAEVVDASCERNVGVELGLGRPLLGGPATDGDDRGFAGFDEIPALKRPALVAKGHSLLELAKKVAIPSVRIGFGGEQGDAFFDFFVVVLHCPGDERILSRHCVSFASNCG